MRPTDAVARISAYQVPRAAAPVDLHLDGNEGATPSAALLTSLADEGPDLLRRYPDAKPLEALLAHRCQTSPDRLVVTAGADDALDRCCRALLGPNTEMVFPVPGFSMLARYARIVGADVVEVDWDAPRYPTQAVLHAITPRTRVVVVTSPNNPTGGYATCGDVERLAEAAPHALILVDLAYAEFADEDLLPTVLGLDNALATLTLSKAWGLAGLRVGYAVGPARVVGWLRAAGQPYAVSAVSLALATARLRAEAGQLNAFVQRVRVDRDAMMAVLTEVGAVPWQSQGNFVMASVNDPLWARDGMAGLGIGIRAFPGKPRLEDKIRISCPGDPAQMRRVTWALRAVLRPQAVLFDMDGVLANVSGSYRAAIVATADEFGVTVTPEQIRAEKERGNANDDWILTHRLVLAGGGKGTLEQVTAAFERRYQGTDGQPGLRSTETLMMSREALLALGKKVKLAVVTGRPRRDALVFLEEYGIADLFEVMATMEDQPGKPDPHPVRCALERLGVSSAWMIGDTVDDIRASRAAGVVPIGVVAPGDNSAQALIAAGAARVLENIDDLLGMVP